MSKKVIVFAHVVLLLGSSFTVSQAYAQATHEPAAQLSEQPSTTPSGFSDEEWQALSGEDRAYIRWARSFLDSLEPTFEQASVLDGRVTLDLGENYYFLNSSDSKRVLEEAWGNPPGNEVAGMIFPRAYDPLATESWGITLTYADEGHVDDEDASSIDYDDLLTTMKEDTELGSEYRVEQGYEPISLVGWAEPPRYDPVDHRLHWAKELKFGDAELNTLNYNVRVLGREGTLELNFIANMQQLNEVNASLDEVLAIANFTPGNQYADFDASTDQTAAYGIAGLIAGGAIAAKKGFFVAALVLLKKFGVYIIIGLAGLIAFMRKRLKKAE